MLPLFFWVLGQEGDGTSAERCTGVNGLQLNPNKSEVMQFIAHGRDRVNDVMSFQVSNAAIKLLSTIKSLGVTLDRKLLLDAHVTIMFVDRLYYCHIRALRLFASRCLLCCQNCCLHIIGSRLGYCNSLLVDTTKSNLM